MNNKEFSNYKNELKKMYKDVSQAFSDSGLISWIHSGSLLGAIRDGGTMIEWDDDIDLMSSYLDWKKRKFEIINTLKGKSIHVIDEVGESLDGRIQLKIVKFFSSKTFILNISGKDYEHRPCIDLFLATSYSKKNISWKMHSWLYRISWIWQDGFERYKYIKGYKVIRTFLMNLITYPLKLVFKREKMNLYLLSPLRKDTGNGLLRRVDYWSDRKIFYDKNNLKVINFLEVDTFINENYENELIQTFGKNWKKPKKTTPHIMQEWRVNSKEYSKYCKL